MSLVMSANGHCSGCYAFNILLVLITGNFIFTKAQTTKNGAVIDSGKFTFILSNTRENYDKTDIPCQQWGTTELEIMEDSQYYSMSVIFSDQRFSEYTDIWLHAQSHVLAWWGGGVKYSWPSGNFIDQNTYFKQGEPNNDTSNCTLGDGDCLAMHKDLQASTHMLEDDCCEKRKYFLCTYNGSPATPSVVYSEDQGVLTCESLDERNGRISSYRWYKDVKTVNDQFQKDLNIKHIQDPSGNYACQIMSNHLVLSLKSNVVNVVIIPPAMPSTSIMVIHPSSSQVMETIESYVEFTDSAWGTVAPSFSWMYTTSVSTQAVELGLSSSDVSEQQIASSYDVTGQQSSSNYDVTEQQGTSTHDGNGVLGTWSNSMTFTTLMDSTSPLDYDTSTENVLSFYSITNGIVSNVVSSTPNMLATISVLISTGAGSSNISDRVNGVSSVTEPVISGTTEATNVDAANNGNIMFYGTTQSNIGDPAVSIVSTYSYIDPGFSETGTNASIGNSGSGGTIQANSGDPSNNGTSPASNGILGDPSNIGTSPASNGILGDPSNIGTSPASNGILGDPSNNGTSPASNGILGDPSNNGTSPASNGILGDPSNIGTSPASNGNTAMGTTTTVSYEDPVIGGITQANTEDPLNGGAGNTYSDGDAGSSGGSTTGSNKAPVLTLAIYNINNNLKKAYFLCTKTDSNHYFYKWFKDGEVLHNYSLKNYLIKYSNESDASGEYQCSAGVHSTVRSNTVNLLFSQSNPNTLASDQDNEPPMLNPSSVAMSGSQINVSTQLSLLQQSVGLGLVYTISQQLMESSNSLDHLQTSTLVLNTFPRITTEPLTTMNIWPQSYIVTTSTKTTSVAATATTTATQNTNNGLGTILPQPEITSTYYSIYPGYSVKLSCTSPYTTLTKYVFEKILISSNNINDIPTISNQNQVIYNGPLSYYTIQSISIGDESFYTCKYYTDDDKISPDSESIFIAVILNGSLCHCPCGVGLLPSTLLLDADLDQIRSGIHRSLSVSTSNLSSTIRKKTSAVDKRGSSAAIGYVAIVVLTLTTLLFVGADTNRFIPIR